jgi:cellulase/cellobiase CelA1
MQLWHGTADTTLFFPNFGEEIKQWTNVLGVSQTAAFTDSPQSGWTRTRYGGTGIDAPVEAISVQGAGHVLPLAGMAARAIQFFGLDRDPSPDVVPPTPPTNLAASNVSSSGAVLSWGAATDNVAVVGYRIFQQQGSAAATQIGTSTGTSFTVTGLAASTSYSFFVRAVDPGGNISASSNTVAVTTPAGGGGTGVTPSVAVTNDWGTGYCATLTVTNNTASAVTWQVTFPVRGTINNLWNGTFTQSGGSVTVSGVSFNAVLPPGQSTNSVGFCAQI